MAEEMTTVGLGLRWEDTPVGMKFRTIGRSVTDADITGILGGGRGDFPGIASRFETDLVSLAGESRRVLVISSGWLSLSSDGHRSALVSVVDISEMTQLKRVNEEISRLNRDLADNMQKLKEAQDEILRRGRMAQLGQLTATVAHEIRNPLSAISQANALLDEDITDPRLKRLTAMVSQNAKRLEKIVNDILNVARVQPYDQDHLVPGIPLTTTTHRICTDWALQCACQQRLSLHLGEQNISVQFDNDHLRRVLVNLLDNALRYTEDQPDAIQVVYSAGDGQTATLMVWSDSARMDQSVERHLFEPFFSSDSRSSGLGLYICRELCERHGATLTYQRSVRPTRNRDREGNAFVIVFQRASAPIAGTAADTLTTPWQPNLY